MHQIVWESSHCLSHQLSLRSLSFHEMILRTSELYHLELCYFSTASLRNSEAC